eukprot:scaffold116767_cov57-Attheya_sp.AAC.3
MATKQQGNELGEEERIGFQILRPGLESPGQTGSKDSSFKCFHQTVRNKVATRQQETRWGKRKEWERERERKPIERGTSQRETE